MRLPRYARNDIASFTGEMEQLHGGGIPLSLGGCIFVEQILLESIHTLTNPLDWPWRL